jgi:hypothetical protein
MESCVSSGLVKSSLKTQKITYDSMDQIPDALVSQDPLLNRESGCDFGLWPGLETIVSFFRLEAKSHGRVSTPTAAKRSRKRTGTA